MDQKKKFFLFKQSSNFCAVPWNHVKIDTNGDVSTCVRGTETLGNLTVNNINDILENPKLKEVRDNLYNDVPSTNCQRCTTMETVSQGQSYRFLRDLYNPMFIKSSVDYSNSSEFVLNGVDLHWSSLCNLKCITCWAHQSSSIAKEQNLPVQHTPNVAANSAIDFIVNNQHTLKEIYMSGGEPTMINHNLRLLQKLRTDLDFTIRVNTNMMFDDNNLVIQELKRFPKVLFTISADALTDRFNYIRRGAEWTRFMKNLDHLMKLHFSWRVNSVYFVGTALHLPETQEYFMKNYNINDFTINQVSMGQYSIRCRNLPDHIKSIVKEKLTNHSNKYVENLNLIGQLQNCLAELQYVQSESYIEFFDNVDKIAGTNWKKIFPELA